MNYSSYWVSGFAMLPTYIVVGMLLSSVPIWVWAISMPIVLYICSLIYHHIVVSITLNDQAQRLAYIKLFVIQLLIYFFGITLLSLLR